MTLCAFCCRDRGAQLCTFASKAAWKAFLLLATHPEAWYGQMSPTLDELSD